MEEEAFQFPNIARTMNLSAHISAGGMKYEPPAEIMLPRQLFTGQDGPVRVSNLLIVNGDSFFLTTKYVCSHSMQASAPKATPKDSDRSSFFPTFVCGCRAQAQMQGGWLAGGYTTPPPPPFELLIFMKVEPPL
jgi:hypothetical protein